MTRAYKIGLIVGRFQTFHIGQEGMIDKGLALCERLLIFVGSAQERGTFKNPFSVETRMDMLRTVYEDTDRVMLCPLADLTKERRDDNPNWGTYVIENAKQSLNKAPDLIITGDDRKDFTWFEIEDAIDTILIPRSKIPVSATMVRDFMVADNRAEWEKCVNPKLHKMYDRLRAELMAIEEYRNMKV